MIALTNENYKSKSSLYERNLWLRKNATKEIKNSETFFCLSANAAGRKSYPLLKNESKKSGQGAANKRDVNQHLKKEDKDEPINTILADVLKIWNYNQETVLEFIIGK
ncbi:hypothetical protein [Domibacillus tundrae]|uniref:hypothetical protein n=1 Tax=Domibacillus tundrae TaxID=1587527 RepID=UPI00339ADC74